MASFRDDDELLAEHMDNEAELLGELIERSVLKEYIPALCSPDGSEPFLSHYDSTPTGACVYICICACVCMCVCVCLCVYMCVCMYVHVCACVCICLCVRSLASYPRYYDMFCSIQAAITCAVYLQ